MNSILLLGTIISLLLFFVMLSLTKSRNQALSLADMTLDLEKANLGLKRDLVERKLAEEEREKLIVELQKALDEIKTLHGIIPICSYCKKIRDDAGAWGQVEEYVHKHTHAKFSHGVCPECFQKEMDKMDKEDGRK